VILNPKRDKRVTSVLKKLITFHPLNPFVTLVTLVTLKSFDAENFFTNDPAPEA